MEICIPKSPFVNFNKFTRNSKLKQSGRFYQRAAYYCITSCYYAQYPVHPGKLLLREFLEPLGISQRKLAKDIGVPPRRVNEIILGKRGVSADTALRLGRHFCVSAGFWLNLQKRYEMDVAMDLIGDRLAREVKVRKTAA
ncbi:MAG: HigA family addiction module antidote protein [Nitrospinae bacterium]|nr:HigA family addiction module antidote protein [Nitrospinota bacterium]